MLAMTINTYGADSDVTDTARLLETWVGLPENPKKEI
jgi:hypothetical protein